MTDLLKTPISFVWVVLVLLTAVSLIFGTQVTPSTTFLVIAGLVILAMFKVRLVILHFMEIKDAPWLLRGALEFWVLGVCVMIIFMYAQ